MKTNSTRITHTRKHEAQILTTLDMPHIVSPEHASVAIQKYTEMTDFLAKLNAEIIADVNKRRQHETQNTHSSQIKQNIQEGNEN